MFACAVTSSYAFMLPVATAPNAVVFSSGRIPIGSMARTGLWLNLLSIALISAYHYLFWRFEQNLEAGLKKIRRIDLHHAAHSPLRRHWRHSRLFLRYLGDGRFSCQQHACYRAGIFQSHTETSLVGSMIPASYMFPLYSSALALNPKSFLVLFGLWPRQQNLPDRHFS